MKAFYRLSDQSYPKMRLPGATKERCLNNFIATFPDADLIVIADNCTTKTKEWLSAQLPVTTKVPHFCNLGNAESFNYTLALALECPDDELVYFVEDDYLHKLCSPQMLLEGIQHADYVTLYDHPDKYTAEYDHGEVSKVFRTNGSHWRHTVSTCMTFAVTAKTLKEDAKIWREKTLGQPHPPDHEIFVELGKQGRKVAVCVPGVACHTDMSWGVEEWAMDMMELSIKAFLYSSTVSPIDVSQIYAMESKLKRLMCLSVLEENIKKGKQPS